MPINVKLLEDSIRNGITQFLDTVEEEQLFAKVSITDYYYMEINERLQTSVKILDKKLGHMDTDQQIDFYFLKLGELGFTPEEAIYDTLLHSISVGASMYEVAKMFLYIILDKSIGIKETMPLGTLLMTVGQKLYQSEELTKNLIDSFDVKFRNRIVHEKWWYKDRLFYYVDEDDNNIVKHLTIEQLREKLIRISLISTYLTKIYKEKYESKYAV